MNIEIFTENLKNCVTVNRQIYSESEHRSGLKSQGDLGIMPAPKNRQCLGCDFIDDNKNDKYSGQAVLPAKGHESRLYKTPSSSVGLFFTFTIVKMKGQINN